MELKIIDKKEQPLLSRTEIVAEAVFDAATPSKQDIKSKIASLVKSNENLVVVRHIYTEFGAKKAKILAYSYINDAELKKIEPKKKEKKAPVEKEESKKE